MSAIQAGPGGAERRDQGRFTGQPGVPGRPVRTGLPIGADVEDLVIHAGHLALPGPDMPAPQDALRRESSSDIERAGRGCPPVHEQRLVIGSVIENADPPDIAEVTLGQVQPAKAQPVLGRIQLGDPLRVHLHESVTF
jgi:hypothetical protein